MTTPPRRASAAARAWWDSWQHVTLTLGSGALVVVGLAVVPTEKLDKLGRGLEHLGGILVHDAGTIAGAIGVLSGAAIAAWTAWSAAQKRARAKGAADERAVSEPPRSGDA